MNIMRKLRNASAVGGMGASTTGSIDDATGGANPQHTALGLMHLKKLFSEYTHPPQQLSEAERDDKLYNMLPLFCKVNMFLTLIPLASNIVAFFFIYLFIRYCQQYSNVNIYLIKNGV